MAGESLRKKEYATANTRKPRARLLGWGRILTFTLLIVAVMTLLYPRTALIEYVTRNEQSDFLSDLYLRNLLKNEPRNPQLLMKRLEEMLGAGRLSEADQFIDALRPAPDPADRLKLAEYKVLIRERQAFAHPPDSAERRRALPALYAALAALADEPLSAAQRGRLADKALSYGDSALARRLYLDLATAARRDERFAWLDRAAQAAFSRRDYEGAANIYLDARSFDPDPVWQKKTFLAAIAALRASGRADAALARAESELGPLANDPDILIFMVKLAQAANRNDRAERYVRRLLRFAELGSLVLPGNARIHAAALGRPGVASDARALSGSRADCRFAHESYGCWQRIAAWPEAAGAAAASTMLQRVALEPRLPFDDEIYRLGYEVFLANKNLQSAYAVAHAAVKQAPDNALWRERLALVAEWNGQPAHALEQWKYLALHQGSEKAWQAILRLAPGLFDEQSVIQALMHEYAAGRLDDARLLRLVQAFEATGEAARGVEFLASAYARTRRPRMLEQQAWLEERLGRYGDAIATLRRLGRAQGYTPALARRLATLLIAQGYTAEAYRALQEFNQGAARRDVDYQTLLAELAWTLQDRRAAIQIYESIDAQRPLEDYEAERLIMLVRGENPSAAGRLAARLWDRHHRSRYLDLALESYLLAKDVPAAQALLSSLAPETLASLSAHANFLMLRAEVHRQATEHAEAVRLLQLARRLEPVNDGLAVQLVWTMIEARDRAQLAPLLDSLRPRAATEASYWGPMGAGYMLLARPREALPYYMGQVGTRQDDYLWQIDYAQVLDAAGRADMAWRVRRHAWLNLRRGGTPDADQLDQWRGLATLALKFAPGDASAQWLREWLRLDRDGDTQRSAEARELATAWYLSHEQHAAARLWLTQQYGRQLQAPGWAEAALALQANDRVALKKIAEGERDDIPTETRVEAAMQLREFELARKLAASGLELDPADDGLHLQLTDSIWQQQNRVSAGVRREKLGAVERKGWHTGAQWSLRPALKMGLILSDDTLSTLDASRLRGLPGADRKITLMASLDHVNGETRVALSHRSAWRAQTGVEVVHELRLDRRLTLSARAGVNVDANENDLLSVAGSKDTIQLGAQWRISKRDYLIADLSASMYRGQDRSMIGRGSGLSLQLRHHLRVDYPDLTVKLVGSVFRFDESGTSSPALRALLPAGAALLPGSFEQYGVGIGIGESIGAQFSRSFRPYATFDLLHSSGAGWGYGMEWGFVVSPTGKDWLRGRYRTGENAFGGTQDATLFDLEYRYLF